MTRRLTERDVLEELVFAAARVGVATADSEIRSETLFLVTDTGQEFTVNVKEVDQ